MSGYIKNIGASRTADGNIAVSWSWPQECGCVRIVFEHRTGGADISSMTAEQISSVSDLCFQDEFRVAGGKYIYPLSAADAGLLKFRVYCCESPENTLWDRSSETARITGITLNINWRLTEKKSGKLYKKVTFVLDSEHDVPAGTLGYRTVSSGAEYVIGRGLPAGHTEVGPVILGVSESVALCLAPGHEDEFVLHAV